MDVGEVNGRVFINNSSVGLYPRLVWERERHQHLGKRKAVALVAAAWTVWRRYRHVSVVIDPAGGRAVRVRTPFVFIGNNVYQLSGLEFGSRQHLSDGRLHVCMAPELSSAEMANVFAAALIGRLVTLERFESVKTTQVTIDAHRSRLGVALDGEVTVMQTPLRYRIRPRALRVAVPRPSVSDTPSDRKKN